MGIFRLKNSHFSTLQDHLSKKWAEIFGRRRSCHPDSGGISRFCVSLLFLKLSSFMWFFGTMPIFQKNLLSGKCAWFI